MEGGCFTVCGLFNCKPPPQTFKPCWISCKKGDEGMVSLCFSGGFSFHCRFLNECKSLQNSRHSPCLKTLILVFICSPPFFLLFFFFSPVCLNSKASLTSPTLLLVSHLSSTEGLRMQEDPLICLSWEIWWLKWLEHCYTKSGRGFSSLFCHVHRLLRNLLYCQTRLIFFLKFWPVFFYFLWLKKKLWSWVVWWLLFLEQKQLGPC